MTAGVPITVHIKLPRGGRTITIQAARTEPVCSILARIEAEGGPEAAAEVGEGARLVFAGRALDSAAPLGQFRRGRRLSIDVSSRTVFCIADIHMGSSRCWTAAGDDSASALAQASARWWRKASSTWWPGRRRPRRTRTPSCARASTRRR